MECTGKKLACLKAGKRLLWSLACWPNFSHFHQWGLHLFLRRKNKNYRTCNVCQSQDGGFLEDLFAVCPETWVALDTANLVTFFAEVWQKRTHFFLVQPGPYRLPSNETRDKPVSFLESLQCKNQQFGVMLVRKGRERDWRKSPALQPVNCCGVDCDCFFSWDVRAILWNNDHLDLTHVSSQAPIVNVSNHARISSLETWNKKTEIRTAPQQIPFNRFYLVTL